MKNITILGSVLSLSLLSACGGESESVKVTKDFWKAFSTNDQALMASVLKNPKDAEFLAGGKSTLQKYEVLGEVAGGVEVKFSKFCYADMVVPTAIVDVDGKKKIDFMATLKAQMKAHKMAKPTKKYCYDFEEQPLSGKLNNTSWQFVEAYSREINWGDKVTTNTSLFSEKCDHETYGQCSLPNLIISNLDLNSEGGNFTNQVNVTIHVPPSDNIVVSTGSYRISKEGNQKKVELSFKQDEQNTLSGYFYLKGE